MPYKRKWNGYDSRQKVAEIKMQATAGKRAIYDVGRGQSTDDLLLCLLSLVQQFDEIAAIADELDFQMVEAMRFKARNG